MFQQIAGDGRSALTGRAFEEICRLVRGRIASGELAPGDKLPAERELAEQLGVGRNAVREAFRSLEIGGVIELRKGRSGGAFILGPNATRLTHAMQDLHDMGSVSLAEMTEARIILADQIVRLAAERATEADFEALEADIEMLDELTRNGRIEERAMRATNFFHLIAKSTGNRALMLMDASLSEIIRRFVELAMREGKPQIPTLFESRRRFLVHLRKRDAEAASRDLRGQLLDLHKTLLRLIPSETTAPTVARKRRSRAK